MDELTFDNLENFIIMKYKNKIILTSDEENKKNCIDILISSYVSTFIIFNDLISVGLDEIQDYAEKNFYSIGQSTLLAYQDDFIKDIRDEGEEVNTVILKYYDLGKKLAEQRIIELFPILSIDIFSILHSPIAMNHYYEELKFKLNVLYGDL